ncbi:MAG: hypothetical protein A2297_06410 [Elusimicrobia bacterium RIFOXYB2_FULL_48_7]|nr:MAG: hypothetical protein A2297_06410 [Elusimicrobia bacterium RIFOXYB2_FULL_48_7]
MKMFVVADSSAILKRAHKWATTCSLLVLLAPSVNSAVLTPDSLSDIDVQAKINIAVDGDTIQLPVGISTWSTGITLSNKAITLRGSGVVDPSRTLVITRCTNTVTINGQDGKPWRVTNMVFQDGVYGSSYRAIYVMGNCKNWRIDHCIFRDNISAIFARRGQGAANLSYGLVDHCTFYASFVMWSAAFNSVQVGSDGDTSWTRPLELGTSNALYFEDNFFDYPDHFNTNINFKHGGRIVFRYNKSNISIEQYNNDSDDSGRGNFSLEVYNNVFGTGRRGGGEPMCFYGGTGVVFDNTVLNDGSFNRYTFTLGYYGIIQPFNYNWVAGGWTQCDGESPYDGNLAEETGSVTGAVASTITLVCAGKNWTVNQYRGNWVWNLTDNSKAFITSNTSNTITASLYSVAKRGLVYATGVSVASFTARYENFSSNQWVGYYALNVKDFSRGIITSNTSSVIYAALSEGSTNTWRPGNGGFKIVSYTPTPGSDFQWQPGDSFRITNGWPCFDQVGRTFGTDTVDGTTVQKSVPLYLWNNNLAGAPLYCTYNTGLQPQNYIKPNRDYYECSSYADAQSKGMVYTPYTYPHPLTLLDVVDPSSPIAPSAVYDGTGADVDVTYSTTVLHANWTAGADPESGISGYQFAVGITAGGGELVGWNTIGNVTSTTTYKNLLDGIRYYFSIRSVNGLGLVSTGTAVSDGQNVAFDSWPPNWGNGSTVRDGTGIDISTTISTTQLSANWDAATDTESGVSGYQYAIGMTLGGTETLGWQTPISTRTVTHSGLNLSIGSTYYFTVKAVNGFGIAGLALNSNGVVVVSTADATPPGPPSSVRDGATPGFDISATISIATLSANWSAGSDTESGITGYQYAVGTSAGASDTAGWTTIGNVLVVSRSSLILTAGTTYYFSVKSINGNNLVSAAANSNGQYVIAVDTGSPSPPPNIMVVRDGTGEDVSFTTSLTQLNANWDAVVDPQGIEKYWYAIGTLPGNANTQSWTDNGQITFFNAAGLVLSEGTTYYVSVKAENGAGYQSSATTSNGQVVLPPDTTPPGISLVTAQNITANTAAVAWTTDEGATTLVEYGRTTSYGTQTIEDISFTLNHSVALTGLIGNSEYHYRVISRDTSGNETTSSDYTFTTSAPAQPVSETIHAYPNPCRISAANPAKFRIANMAGGEVAVYAVSGRLIRKLTNASAAEIQWDGKNADGQNVGRGIYIYKITNTAGDTVTGKLALTK